MFFTLAIATFYLCLAVMLAGFVVTVIAWIYDFEKMEKVSIRISLLGVLLAITSFSSCSLGVFTAW